MSVSQDSLVVIYEDGQVPRLLRLSKWATFLYSLLMPLISLMVLLLIVLFVVYLDDIHHFLKSAGPSQVTTLETELQLTKNQLIQANEELKDFNEKLSQSKSVINSPIIQLIDLPAGFSDLSKDLTKTFIKLENLNTQSQSNTLSLKFNLAKNNQAANLPDRVSGYLFVLLQTNSATYYFPHLRPFNPQNPAVRFAQGEAFTFNTLRPVEASYNLPQVEHQQGVFHIYIFDRLGNLLLQQTHLSGS